MVNRAECKKTLYEVWVVSALLLLSGCVVGGSNDDGGQSAQQCISRFVVNEGVSVTNVCTKTIIVLADNGDQETIGLGRTVVVGDRDSRVVACYEPSVPQNFDGFAFTCS